jgi:hypothetical protein
MERRSLWSSALLLTFCVFAPVLLQAQQQRRTTAVTEGNSLPGSLTVVCTVSSSVGLVQESDGRLHLVIANGQGPADNVSQVQYFLISRGGVQRADQSRVKARKVPASSTEPMPSTPE